MGYTFMMILYLDYEFPRIFITEFTKDIYFETLGFGLPEQWSIPLEKCQNRIGGQIC